MGRRKFELELEALKVGRPTKNREIRMADGEILLRKEEYKNLYENINHIREQEGVVLNILTNTIERYYIIGNILAAMNERVGKTIPRQWLKENLGLSRHIVDTARKVYAHKSDYIDANGTPRKGISLFSKKDQEHLPAPQTVFPQRTEYREKAPRLPCKSGVPTKRYRIRAEPTDNNFYLLHNDDLPIPVVSLSVDLPRNFQQELALERLRDEIQVSLEKYYKELEQTEDDWT